MTVFLWGVSWWVCAICFRNDIAFSGKWFIHLATTHCLTFYCQRLHKIQLWCFCKFSSVQRMKMCLAERSWLTGIGNYTAFVSLSIKNMLYYLKITIVFTLSHCHKEYFNRLGRWWWRNSAEFVDVEKIHKFFVLLLTRVCSYQITAVPLRIWTG